MDKKAEEKRIVILSKGVGKNSVEAGPCCPTIFYPAYRHAPEE